MSTRIINQEINIYDLDIHEEAQLDRYNSVVRVPGGWIYKSFIGTEQDVFKPIGMVFVPYNNEYFDFYTPDEGEDQDQIRVEVPRQRNT